jgi:hypothetical protein
MDITFMMSNTPNPLDDSVQYPSVPITIVISDAADDSDEICRNKREENMRAFENTENYYSLKGAK